MLDGPLEATSLTPVSDRLAALRRYRENWSFFSIEDKPSFTGPDPVEYFYWNGGALPLAFESDRLELVRLGSATRRIEERKWTIETQHLGIYTPHTCAVDLEQDLVMYSGTPKALDE